MAFKLSIQTGTPANSGETTASPTLTFNHTGENRPNRVVVVMAGGRDATLAGDVLISGVTYGGTPMTLVAQDTVGGGGAVAISAGLFIISNPPAGLNSVVVTYGGNIPQAISSAVTFWNVDPTTPQDTPGQATSGTGASIGFILGEITGTDERSLLVGGAMVNDSSGFGLSLPIGSVSIDQVLGAVTSNILYSGLNTSWPMPTINTQLLLNGGAAKAALAVAVLRPGRRRIRVT